MPPPGWPLPARLRRHASGYAFPPLRASASPVAGESAPGPDRGYAGHQRFYPRPETNSSTDRDQQEKIAASQPGAAACGRPRVSSTQAHKPASHGEIVPTGPARRSFPASIAPSPTRSGRGSASARSTIFSMTEVTVQHRAPIPARDRAGRSWSPERLAAATGYDFTRIRRAVFRGPFTLIMGPHSGDRLSCKKVTGEARQRRGGRRRADRAGR